MNFIANDSWREALSSAKNLIPSGLHKYLGCDFIIGKDTFALALYCSGFDDVDTADGRAYSETCHVAFDYHTVDRRNVMVLPGAKGRLRTAVHEFGHVLHWQSGYWESPAQIVGVSKYGRTDYLEAFAEAFTSWLIPGYADRPDDRILTYFEFLARG